MANKRKDPAGNRQVVERANGTRVTYTYDPANQLTCYLVNGAPTTLTHDAGGNPLQEIDTTNSRRVTNTWDAENRLATLNQMAHNENRQYTNVYNADGQRGSRRSL